MMEVFTELTVAQRLHRRIAQLHDVAPESVGDLFRFRLERWEEDTREYVFIAELAPWMRNAAGTLHGGMCAALVDQAMGFVAYCIKPGEGAAPTVQMNVDYHRPLPVTGEVWVRVRVVSQTRSLMRLSAESWTGAYEKRLCLSATGTYFFKSSAQ